MAGAHDEDVGPEREGQYRGEDRGSAPHQEGADGYGREEEHEGSASPRHGFEKLLEPEGRGHHCDGDCVANDDVLERPAEDRIRSRPAASPVGARLPDHPCIAYAFRTPYGHRVLSRPSVRIFEFGIALQAIDRGSSH